MKKLIYDQSDAGKQEFAAVLEQYEFNSNVPTNIKIGTKVTGNLVQKNNKFATIEFGGKSSITVYNTNSEKYIIENLKIGQEVSVLIKDIIDKDNFEYIGSLYDLNMQKINLFLLEAVKTNLILTGKVIELLHSGYNILVNINDSEVTLFMPHLLTDVNKLSDPESILNTDIDFCIESINIKGKISYIASRKKYLMSLIPNELKKLKRGMYCVGTVTGTADFAVFVQFNNVLTGMIHKSNLIQEYKDKLQDIKPGDSISFYIKDILKQGTKINLFLTQEIKESL
jgi:small subunit ribosomal protein S1